MALSDCTKEAIYVSGLFKEISGTKIVVKIFCDNQGATKLSVNPVLHKRTKHIHARYHFKRERVVQNKICLSYCPTSQMLADVLTKSLSEPRHKSLMESLGLRS